MKKRQLLVRHLHVHLHANVHMVCMFMSEGEATNAVSPLLQLSTSVVLQELLGKGRVTAGLY